MPSGGTTRKCLVGSVEDDAVTVGVAKTPAFLGGEKLLLDFSRERMIALRVRLSDQIGQLQGRRFPEFLRRAFFQVVSSGQGRGGSVAKSA